MEILDKIINNNNLFIFVYLLAISFYYQHTKNEILYYGTIYYYCWGIEIVDKLNPSIHFIFYGFTIATTFLILEYNEGKMMIYNLCKYIIYTIIIYILIDDIIDLKLKIFNFNNFILCLITYIISKFIYGKALIYYDKFK